MPPRPRPPSPTDGQLGVVVSSVLRPVKARGEPRPFRRRADRTIPNRANLAADDAKTIIAPFGPHAERSSEQGASVTHGAPLCKHNVVSSPTYFLSFELQPQIPTSREWMALDNWIARATVVPWGLASLLSETNDCFTYAQIA